MRVVNRRKHHRCHQTLQKDRQEAIARRASKRATLAGRPLVAFPAAFSVASPNWGYSDCATVAQYTIVVRVTFGHARVDVGSGGCRSNYREEVCLLAARQKLNIAYVNGALIVAPRLAWSASRGLCSSLRLSSSLSGRSSAATSGRGQGDVSQHQSDRTGTFRSGRFSLELSHLCQPGLLFRLRSIRAS